MLQNKGEKFMSIDSMKKIRVFLFVLVVLLLFCQGCGASTNINYEKVIIDGIEYHFYDYDNEPYYYVYKAQNKNITSVSIEEYINGYPVRKVGRDDSGWLVAPFEGCTKLTKISIPNTVQVIGNSAFADCSALETITLPKSIEVIYSFAFKGCTLLKSIVIPDAVETIGYASFKNCRALVSIVLPKNLKEISWQAFEGCSSLRKLDLPNGVAKIGERAFLDCSSLEKITLPDSITTMEKMAFWGCKKLSEFKIPRGITVISEYLTFNCTNMVKVYIPKSVAKIEKSAFGYDSHRYVPQIYYESTKENWRKVVVEEGNRQYTDLDNFIFNVKW